uniref:Uncharacterized protein 1 n=1 Tax=Halisarca dujardinii TaxID=2583056 RepID=A0AA96MI11_HALDU|nr:uncharacterized protein 1 [Halisarca dujardinii]
MSFSYVAEEDDSKVDYTRILAPQYDPEIVPSRKTREPDNAILQSHDGLRYRRSSEKESPRLPRKFDYAHLYFSPSSTEKPLPSLLNPDYVNLDLEEAIPTALVPDHVVFPVVKDIKGCYVNLEVSRPTEVAHRRSSSSCQLHAAPSSPPPPLHPLSRWQSERLHPSTKSITGALQPPMRDYQNIRPTSRQPSPAAGLSPAASLAVARAQSFQSPLRPWDKPSLQRNPTTGEYSHSDHDPPIEIVLEQATTRRTGRHAAAGDRGHRSGAAARSVSSVAGGGGGGSNLPRPPWGVVVRRLPLRSQSEVRSSKARLQAHRKTHILDRPAEQRRHSLMPDYQNLWYLEPESFSILEGHHTSGMRTRRRSSSTDGQGSSTEGWDSGTDERGSVCRGSVISLRSAMSSDYSFDHLQPHRPEETSPSDIITQSQVDASSQSSCSTPFDSHGNKDHFRPMSTPPTVGAHSRDDDKRRSYQQAPPPLPKRSSAKARTGKHLGLFKVQYLGQHPTNRFSGEVDHCLRKMTTSVHFAAKEVFVYVTNSVLRLTPPHSDLLFASFSVEHVLGVESSLKTESVVGIVFKRSKAKCACHVFDCKDRLTAKIFLKTVKEALVSIPEEESLRLKARAEEIERCSLLPSDLFGAVTYVGSCGISPNDVITKTIDSALSAGALRPSGLHSVVLSLRAVMDRRGGVLEVFQRESPAPLHCWHLCDVEMVGCRVADRRYIGLHLLEEEPQLHILHFGGVVGGVAFLAVLRDKFGVCIDEGEFVSPRRSPSCRVTEAGGGVPAGASGEPWRRPVSKKLSFKKLICAIAK